MTVSTNALEVYLSWYKRHYFFSSLLQLPEDMFKSLLEIPFPTKPLPRAVNKKQNVLTWVSLYFHCSAFLLWDPQWIMKWLWSGKSEKSKAAQSVKHADPRGQRLQPSSINGRNPWNNWHLISINYSSDSLLILLYYEAIYFQGNYICCLVDTWWSKPRKHTPNSQANSFRA